MNAIGRMFISTVFSGVLALHWGLITMISWNKLFIVPYFSEMPTFSYVEFVAINYMWALLTVKRPNMDDAWNKIIIEVSAIHIGAWLVLATGWIILSLIG